jgi:predicted dienelactone hydrolase
VIASLLALVPIYLGLAVAYQEVVMTPDEPRADAPAYGGWGAHPVGTREATTDGPDVLPLSLWYPAADVAATSRTGYAYELKWFVRAPAPVRSVGRAARDAAVASSGGPAPVVVVSSGFALPRGGYVWLAERLASHGFVVVAPEHRELMDAALDGFWQGVIDRPGQVAEVLDWLDGAVAPGGVLAGVADPARLAVVGHSLGGTTALALAGARLDLDDFARLCTEPAWSEGEQAFLCDLVLEDVAAMAERAGLPATPVGVWPSHRDERVDVVVAMASDAFLFGPDGLAEIEAPLLAVGGTDDASAPFAWSSTWAFEHAAGPRKAVAGLEGAGHMVFAGSCGAVPFFRTIGAGSFCSDAVWAMDEAHDAVAHLVTAFLRAELAGDAAAAGALTPAAVDLPRVTYRAAGF